MKSAHPVNLIIAAHFAERYVTYSLVTTMTVALGRSLDLLRPNHLRLIKIPLTKIVNMPAIGHHPLLSRRKMRTRITSTGHNHLPRHAPPKNINLPQHNTRRIAKSIRPQNRNNDRALLNTHHIVRTTRLSRLNILRTLSTGKGPHNPNADGTL